MKYSNLGTINECIKYMVEHGRPCCNLLDSLLHCNLASWCPFWGKSPWLATTTTPCSSLPCHCHSLALLLPLHHVPLSCMQLLSCQASCSLPSISSPGTLCKKSESGIFWYSFFENANSQILTPFWLGEERGEFYYSHWIQLHAWMTFQWPWCPQWVSMTNMSKWRCCALVITWCAVGENVLDCKGGGQEKWSSGLQEASPTGQSYRIRSLWHLLNQSILWKSLQDMPF